MLKIVNRKPVSGKAKTPFLFLLFSSVFLFRCTHVPVEQVREPASAPNKNILNEKIIYDTCDNKNSRYLENLLAQIPTEYLKINANETQEALPLRCIQLAQKSFVGNYAVCDGEEAKPKITAIKPCMSENYVNLSYNAYHDVMDCFNLDPKQMYYQIMIESGFHVNAINKSGFDSGMAQFTANGIKRVTANNLVERTRRVLLESSRSSCQRISSIVGSFSIDAFSVKKRCSMIALPKNPYRAMLFSYLHTMLDQLVMDDLLASLPELYEGLTDRTRRQFLYLSYNRGMTGLMRLLRGYVESRNYFGYKITENDLDLNKNLSQVKSILALEPDKREILKTSKIRNLTFAEYAVINNATYLSDMSAARDYVERYYGNSCGEF